MNTILMFTLTDGYTAFTQAGNGLFGAFFGIFLSILLAVSITKEIEDIKMLLLPIGIFLVMAGIQVHFLYFIITTILFAQTLLTTPVILETLGSLGNNLEYLTNNAKTQAQAVTKSMKEATKRVSDITKSETTFTPKGLIDKTQVSANRILREHQKTGTILTPKGLKTAKQRIEEDTNEIGKEIREKVEDAKGYFTKDGIWHNLPVKK